MYSCLSGDQTAAITFWAQDACGDPTSCLDATIAGYSSDATATDEFPVSRSAPGTFWYAIGDDARRGLLQAADKFAWLGDGPVFLAFQATAGTNASLDLSRLTISFFP